MAVIVVTGAGRGLGFQLVNQYASDSSVVTVIAASRGSPSAGLVDLISGSNGKVIYLQLDVTDQSSVLVAATRLDGDLGGRGIDILINCAGIQFPEPDGITTTILERTLATNVVGVHTVTSTLIPLLQRGSQKKIVNITSTLGSLAMIKVFEQSPVSSYKISKAAVNMLTAQYALQLGKDGFTVVAISPGWLKTNLGGQADGLGHLTAEEGAKAVCEVIAHTVAAKDNGAFRDIYVPGHEIYTGANPPW